jgi:uncharacterized protein
LPYCRNAQYRNARSQPTCQQPRRPRSEEYLLPAEKHICGNPNQTVWNAYSGAGGKFLAGIWQSEVGKWRIHYTDEEHCHVLQGVSVITDAQGKAVTVSAIDRFVIPRGFVGTWEVSNRPARST